MGLWIGGSDSEALQQSLANQIAWWWEGDRQDLTQGETSGAEQPITASMGRTITWAGKNGRTRTAKRCTMIQLPEALLVLSQRLARPIKATHDAERVLSVVKGHGNPLINPARCFRGNGCFSQSCFVPAASHSPVISSRACSNCWSRPTRVPTYLHNLLQLPLLGRPTTQALENNCHPPDPTAYIKHASAASCVLCVLPFVLCPPRCLCCAAKLAPRPIKAYRIEGHSHPTTQRPLLHTTITTASAAHLHTYCSYSSTEHLDHTRHSTSALVRCQAAAARTSHRPSFVDTQSSGRALQSHTTLHPVPATLPSTVLAQTRRHCPTTRDVL